ncbi:hypothetical protein [Microcoleus asticus]|uniref:hypothetical protein n=1 Tax=Microcoleus asticus TaxID=2815231 RepID=UPI001C12E2A1|nr:hypothetical protein [Microcoleus asticus]
MATKYLFKLTSCTNINNPFLGGQDAHPTRKLILRFTSILPVLENGATSQFKLTSCTNISNGLEGRSTKNKLDCGTRILPVLKKSAKYWFQLIE